MAVYSDTHKFPFIASISRRASLIIFIASKVQGITPVPRITSIVWIAGMWKERPFFTFTAALFLVLSFWFCKKLYFHRSLCRGLPGPPHSFLFGHIPIVLKLMKKIPIRVHPLYYASFLREEYGLSDVFYLDLWPLSFQFLTIFDPEVTDQLIVKDSQPKHSALKIFMGLLAGSSENLLSSDGSEWARWRRIFNPGFSTSHLTTSVPRIYHMQKSTESLGVPASRFFRRVALSKLANPQQYTIS
ncbi:hypothetical protein P154DRAFT_617667 [Amniculicola lignicola CBS 123094]|uniref:Cytochrome P450 n=1 Tax=Amniculicola lignicola CBS 123094 TaxID=1392246 RepID=A0A6A5WQJ2_9PLEO|nr:hypothetical protein P154DRAFT_617667 [Amniculicola lignicola CBS 123094]